MLLEDHQLDSVQWTPLARDINIGVSGGCRVISVAQDGDIVTVTISPDAEGQVVLEAPLGNASGVWHGGFDPVRGLPADWAGRQKFSAVWSLPLAVLCDADENAHVAFAYDCMTASGVLEYGVSEESKSFVSRLGVSAEIVADGEPFHLHIVAEAVPYGSAIRALSGALREGLPERPVSPLAVEPVYSTWYAYSQRISDRILLDQAPIARRLGARSLFIDDGWQEFGDGRWYSGCGDWVPDPVKFPDLAGTVASLEAEGLGTVAWVAPLLLGERSRAFATLGQFAPHRSEGLRTHVLDPRHPEVRRHIVDTCVRLVQDYSLAGLKIDFLNDAMVYAGTPSRGDIGDVGRAMKVLLGEISDAVGAARPGSVIEYRQPYVSPEIAGYADVVRANDCPADADQNRRSTVDLRLLTTAQVVHSDPMMWAPEAGVDAVSRQFFAALFSVPQISMPLDLLPEDQLARIAELIELWRGLREVLVHGEVCASLPAEGYPIVTSRLNGTQVVAAYQPRTLELDLTGTERLVIVNATSDAALPYRVTGGAGALIHTATGEPVELTAEGFLAVPAWDTIDLRVSAP
ncbi:glycoside hydrolase family 36 protein [Microbacterium sp. H1-D42]|uniref:glycoside hydrolase family 36 protein n=1 Tax=Microbacterium sp. H1-D42 TaxID=2925844 RepID=UPI001F53BD8D|nr:glycoside hydrolase family 36 protein [Microbacterium sp. H1-D42]UNK71656.1 alpha-galactosidase [Microbacterium sp. H1-D42]